MSYEISDIISLEIPSEVLQLAAKNAQFMKTKSNSPKLRLLTPEHNKIGYVGHWAVEQVLNRWGLDYESTLEEKYIGGDKYDIRVVNDTLDVKSSMLGVFDRKYYYNKDFYIIKDQVDDEKSVYVSDYVLVHLERDYSEAHIFGVISQEELLECEVVGPCDWPLKFKHANYKIISRHLTPFAKFIFKT